MNNEEVRTLNTEIARATGWDSYTPQFSASLDAAIGLLCSIHERYGLEYHMYIDGDLHACEIGFWSNEPGTHDMVWGATEKTPAMAITQAVRKCPVVMGDIDGTKTGRRFDRQPLPFKPDLDEIKKRADAATPGPWEKDLFKDTYIRIVTRDELPETINGIAGIGHMEAGPEVEADAEFIAHARQDVPALLAYIEWLEDQNQSLHDTIEVAADALIDGWLCVEAAKKIKPTYQAAQDKFDEDNEPCA